MKPWENIHCLTRLFTTGYFVVTTGHKTLIDTVSPKCGPPTKFHRTITSSSVVSNYSSVDCPPAAEPTTFSLSQCVNVLQENKNMWQFMWTSPIAHLRYPFHSQISKGNRISIAQNTNFPTRLRDRRWRHFPVTWRSLKEFNWRRFSNGRGQCQTPVNGTSGSGFWTTDQ